MKKATLLALLLAPLAATAAHAMPAAAFLKTAAGADNAEVGAGNLAAQRAASPAVKDYGRRLASDHGAHLQKVQALADRMHVRLPAGPPADARAEARRLERLHGRAFNRAFAQAMVGDHQKAIALFQAQARSGDRVTAGLARDTLPTLREHLRMARDLAR
jgi:putative membrane protein